MKTLKKIMADIQIDSEGTNVHHIPVQTTLQRCLFDLMMEVCVVLQQGVASSLNENSQAQYTANILMTNTPQIQFFTRYVQTSVSTSG